MLIAARTILHLDFDSYFASVEQQYTPSLRHKPIAVTARNGRTCIIASSRQAKKYGVVTGMRTFEAQRICPDICFVSSDFAKYWEISQKFISICKDYSPLVEVFSIDELFMDVSQTSPLFGGVDCLVEIIKKRIRKEIGEYITVSVGLSHNKLLSKLASSFDKPDGFTRITPDEVPVVYGRISLTDLCGIGPNVAKRLGSLGVTTPLRLRKCPLSCLIAEFGVKEGIFLKNLGLGLDERPLIPYTFLQPVKSISRSHCLAKNEYDKRKILQNIYELCEEIALKLRRLQKRCYTIGVSLRGSGEIHGQKTFAFPMDRGQEIFNALLKLLQENRENQEFFRGFIRQINIYAGNLEDNFYEQQALFVNQRKKRKVLEAVDQINKKFGSKTVINAFLLYADRLPTVPNGYLADKYERQKLALSA